MSISLARSLQPASLSSQPLETGRARLAPLRPCEEAALRIFGLSALSLQDAQDKELVEFPLSAGCSSAIALLPYEYLLGAFNNLPEM